MTDSLIGRTIDGYRIDAMLGRGGMGVVYRARDTELDCDVALKMIAPELAGNETFVENLRTEARLLAHPRIRNCPQIVQVYAMRQSSAGLYIAMEYIDGGSLKDRIIDGALPWPEVVTILKLVLRALEAAHASEYEGEAVVIHRDIKPGNILLTKAGDVKVADFGLAKMSSGDETRTMTRAAAGSLYYMSPEQVRGSSSIDHRTDLYSVGMTAYEMLYGECPFDLESSEYAIMGRIAESKITLPKSPEFPATLRKFVSKSIEKDPDKRYRTAREAIAALDAVDGGDSAGSSRADSGRSKAFAGDTGKTSLSTWIGIGAVALMLLSLLGYLVLYTDIFSGRDGSNSVNPAAAENRLSIDSDPRGATVIVNDDTLGVTPIVDKVVTSNRADIRVVLRGYAARDTIVTAAGGEFPALPRFSMRRLGRDAGPTPVPPVSDRLASVRIETRPSGAHVSVNGTARAGVTPVTLSDLSPGTVSVAVGKDGYLEKSENHDLVVGVNRTLYFELEEDSAPQIGTLTVSADPAGAVFVDGRRVTGSVELTAGSHIVRCGEGEFIYEDTITVRSGSRPSITCYFGRQIRIGVDGNPFGRIYLDGVLLTSMAPTTLSLGVGKHTIEVNVADPVDPTSARDTREGVQTLTILPSLTNREPLGLMFHFD